MIRISYENLKISSLIDFMELLPEYNFICDGDRKEIIIKEKTKDEKNRWYVIYKNIISFNNIFNGNLYMYGNGLCKFN